MTNAEIVAQEIATRYFDVNENDIRTWIENDLADNDNEPADFGLFVSEYKVNEDVSDMTLEDFIEHQLDFLDLTKEESIRPKLWNHMNVLYESLVNGVLAELEDTNDSDESIKRDYYASVL